MRTEREVAITEFLSRKTLEQNKSKLETIIEFAGILAGFSIVATVELQINPDKNQYLLTAFAVTTSLLVACATFAVLITGCILPRLQMSSVVRHQALVKIDTYESLTKFVNIAWILTNTASLFLFILNTILMCWIKYSYFTFAAPLAATIILGSVQIIIAIFGLIFYRQIIRQNYKVNREKYLEMEILSERLNRLSERRKNSEQGSIIHIV